MQNSNCDFDLLSFKELSSLSVSTNPTKSTSVTAAPGGSAAQFKRKGNRLRCVENTRTDSKQPPAVMLPCGTLAVVAVARRLVVAGFAVHLEAVFGTFLRLSGAEFRQVAGADGLPAHTAGRF